MPMMIYRTDNFATWLSGLRDPMAKARIDTRLARIELGLMGDVKPVGAGVSEIRIDYGPGYRIYFAQRGKQVIILLAGGDKGSQTTDIRDAQRIWDTMKRS